MNIFSRITLFIACLVAAPVLSYAQQPALIPMPREVHLASGSTSSASAVVVVPGNNPEDNFAADDLSSFMRARGIRVAPATGAPALVVKLLRDDTPEGHDALTTAGLSFESGMHDDGYVLVIGQGSASVIAQTANGIFYGAQTLKQLLSGQNDQAALPTGTIRDWPAMKYRGIDDDLSRGPFPTLAFQKQQIRTFAAFKINVYSPYFEHTAQYASDPTVAPAGSSLTRAEAEELSRYAAQYHIMVIPEQEAFGHLHHILKYEKYSDLAETPHGSVLAPGQTGTQPLILSWFTQLSQDFPSPFLHVGADETFELGGGRTKADVDKRGIGPVYADFLTEIHSTLKPLNRRLLFWGDVATSDPTAISRLPKDMIAIPWIYWHLDNYDSNILPFKNAGIETWVAPGDSNWSVLYPLGDKALDNISGFIEAGQRLGSTGALTTVWNDDGEGLFNEDWFGVMFGAAASWQPGKSAAEPYQSSFGHVFYNDTTGKVMQAEQELIAATNIFDVSDSVFWMDPWSEAGQAEAAKLRPHLHETRMHAERALSLLAEARAENADLRHVDAVTAMELGARRIDLAAMKFQFSDEMASAYAEAYAQRGGKEKKQRQAVGTLLEEIAGSNGRCSDLRDAYSATKNLYKEAWLAENRPYWLDNVLVRYDLQIQQWQKRADAFDAIRDAWNTTHQLPTPQQAGIAMPAGS